MRSWIGGLAILVVLVGVGQVDAGLVFNDRGTFLAAVVGETVIDFEGHPLGPVVGDPWLPLGIVFDEAGTGDNMIVGSGDGADTNIYAGSSEAADIDISFPTPVLAFGLGVFSNNIHSSSERIIFRRADNSVLIDIEMPLTTLSTSEFVGYIADEPIALVQFIEDADLDYVGIGDVAFGPPIPEPSTFIIWSLLATLGITVGWWRRRRRAP